MYAHKNLSKLLYKLALPLVACLVCSLLQAYACDVYKKNKIIEPVGWNYGDDFFYELNATCEKGVYDIYAIIEYTTDYPFYNIHLKSSIRSNNGECLLETVEDFNLFDSATGKPLGHSSVWGDTIVLKFMIAKNLALQKSENHRLCIGHFMRVDQLLGIKSIAIKVTHSSGKP